jgi:hypothetical protein
MCPLNIGDVCLTIVVLSGYFHFGPFSELKEIMFNSTDINRKRQVRV